MCVCTLCCPSPGRPKDAQIFRGKLEVYIEGQTLKRHIDVSATAVDYNRFMVDQNGTRSEIFDFGDLYIGQKKEFKGFLVNNTPNSYNFRVQIRLGLINLNNVSARTRAHFACLAHSFACALLTGEPSQSSFRLLLSRLLLRPAAFRLHVPPLKPCEREAEGVRARG